MEQPPVSSSLPLAPPPAPAPAALLSSAVTGGCQVRCAGCRMILTVGPGLKEFVCPTCQLLQILPPDPMRPSSHVPAHGIDPSEIQLPCANCKAILNVPHGLSRFACPHCKMELAVDNEVATNVEQEEDGGGILGETFTEDRPPKLSIDPPHPDKPEQEISPSKEKLKVFLRIRPVVTPQKSGGVQKDVWPQRKKDASRTAKASGKKKSVVCLKVNDSHSVTLCSPQSLPNVRTKTEVYEGFSHVFCAESSQIEVYERMVNPLVEDFLKGKSGMLAAMGPSGSGKTHTVFGSAREPGMVSLALHRIFSTKQSNGSKCSRISYLSMFEIYFEQGKGEKMMDLLQGGDLYMQQSNIKGLQETAIHDVQQAESLIASGMLKRSTAMTNSNIHSSRSQCIINIRSGLDNIDEDAGAQSYTTLLTIVDLAGAERQKRTGNQSTPGARLLESSFINNTSMVFGLCLRSLWEHQRNPQKNFHKHFKNSLLTRYLRDFLEGKKRMTLILTAKSGEEDYHDTSYLLRQASPYMNIKYENVEEQPSNAFGSKRQTKTLPEAEQPKRTRFSINEVSMDGQAEDGILHELHKKNYIKKVTDHTTTELFFCPAGCSFCSLATSTTSDQMPPANMPATDRTAGVNSDCFSTVSLEEQNNKGISSVEVISTSVDFENCEERRNEKPDVPSKNAVFVKQDLKEPEEREPSGETADLKEREERGASGETAGIIDVEAKEKKSFKANIADSVKRARENQILSNFSRALWNVLKEYKDKLDASEKAVTVEKERSSALETELNLMKASCSCRREAVAEAPLSGDQSNDVHKVDADTNGKLVEKRGGKGEACSTSISKLKLRRPPRPWSCEEVNALSAGVKNYGKGNWKNILSMYPDVFVGRTAVDLKDKYRNMCRHGSYNDA